MVDVITTHINAPGYEGILKKKTRFFEPILEDIKQYVEETVESELSSMYTFRIEIEEKDPQDWFELDSRYMSSFEPFVKKNSSENEQTINLRVTWTKKNNIRLVQILADSSISTIDNNFTGANQIMFSSENSQQTSAPTEIIYPDQINQHHNGYGDNQTGVTNKTPPSSLDESFELGDSDVDLDLDPDTHLAINFLDPKLWADILEDLKKCPVPNTKEVFDDQNFNLDEDSNGSEMPPDDLGTLLGTDMSPFCEAQLTNENSLDHVQSSSNSKDVQPKPKRKRSHPKNVIKHNKRQKLCIKANQQSARSRIEPEKMLFIRVQPNLEVVPNTKCVSYDESKIPVISRFDPDQMIQFERNIHPFQRPEYLSNRDAVRQQSNVPGAVLQAKTRRKGRNIVAIQGDKSDVSNTTSWLPLLKMPPAGLSKLSGGDPIYMGTAVVKEYRISDTEVGFYAVGNKAFIKEANTAKEKQVEQDHIIVTKDHVKDSIFPLHVHMIQVKYELHKIVGLALFKIKTSAADDPNITFTFGAGIDLPRLVVYFLKWNDETGAYEPDWGTLCLSDYLHQKTISEE